MQLKNSESTDIYIVIKYLWSFELYIHQILKYHSFNKNIKLLFSTLLIIVTGIQFIFKHFCTENLFYIADFFLIK